MGDGILVDTGAAASVLSIEEQCRIRHVLLSHAHLDHVNGLPFLAENIFEGIDAPVAVHASAATVNALRTHLFNGVLWPDFSRIPASSPVLRWEEMQPNCEFQLGPLRVLPIPMTHPGGSLGFLLSGDDGDVAISGDTGPTERFWREVARSWSALRALFVECSFPDRLAALAVETGHLCPKLLRAELAKLPSDDRPIHVYAIKDRSRRETLRDLQALDDPRLTLGEPGESLEF